MVYDTNGWNELTLQILCTEFGFDPHAVLEQDTLFLHSYGKYLGSSGSGHMTEKLFTGTLNINTNKQIF